MENKKPLLVAKDISISFGALKAVDSFNLEINSGELIGLIGPNGAGKTTVFNILTGVYNASSGEYTLDGENVIKTSTSALVKKGLARTFQNIRLFKYLSVLDNVVAAYNFRMKYGILSGMLRFPNFWREEKEAKEKAMTLLRTKLYEIELEKQQSAESAARKSQIGTGDRSEKIRTYNFPQGRVTDHRINLTLYKLDKIMNGDIQEIIDACIAADQSAKLSKLNEG